MSLQELYQAMGMFKEGMQQYGVARGISQAQEQMDALNQQEMSAIEKRTAMTQISQSLAQNLYKTGAPVAQIQGATGAFAPAPINSAEDAYIQGQTKGSLADLATGVQKFSNAPKVEDRQATQAFTASENAKNRAVQLEVAGIKSSAGSTKLKPLSDKQIDYLSSLDDNITIGSTLVKDIEKSPWLVGPAAGRVPGRGIVDPRYAEFKQQVGTWFDKYRKDITGASASDQELSRLEANRPNEKDSPSQFAAKVRAIEKVASDVRNRHLKTLERAGRDVRRFDFKGKDGTETSPEAIEAATPPEEKAAPAAARPAFDIEQHRTDKGKGAAIRKANGMMTASASTFQGNAPAQGYQERRGPKESMDAHAERMGNEIRDLEESKRQIKYPKTRIG